MQKEEREFWRERLNRIPFSVRRRASWYLSRVKKVKKDEWTVWRRDGKTYKVIRARDKVACSCEYYRSQKRACKHIAAVCATEIVEGCEKV